MFSIRESPNVSIPAVSKVLAIRLKKIMIAVPKISAFLIPSLFVLLCFKKIETVMGIIG